MKMKFIRRRLLARGALLPSAGLQARFVSHSEVERALKNYQKSKTEKLELPPSAADRGVGERVVHTMGQELAGNECYSRAEVHVKRGDWDSAIKQLVLLRESHPHLTNHPSVLLILARCYIEKQSYREAKKLLNTCDALHAGTPGLQDMREEVEWGITLHDQWYAEGKQREKEMEDHRKEHGAVSAKHLQLPSDEGFELLGNLPLEAETRNWFREHIPEETLNTMGVAYSAVRGRFLASKKPIPKGTVIFQEKTVLFPPDYTTSVYQDKKVDPKKGLLDVPGAVTPKPLYCSHCQAPIGKERAVCKLCSLSYCSKRCLAEAEGSYHPKECQVLRQDGVRAVRDRLVSAGMGDMWKRWLTMIRVTSVSLSQGNNWPSKMPWMAHLSYREGEHKKASAARTTDDPEIHDIKPTMYGMMATIFAHLFVPIKLGAGWKQLPQETLKKNIAELEREYDLLFDRVKANARKPTYSILPFLTMANHSCLPNARLDDHNRLIAEEDIPAFHEISISYTPKNVPVEMKHFWLQKNRQFNCRCMYCIIREEDERAAEYQSQEDVGAEFVLENRKRSAAYNDETQLMMPDGRLTRKGLERMATRHERMLEKYPKMFREEILAVHEEAARELETKPLASVVQDLRRRKQRLEVLGAQGLVKITDSEKIALEAAIESSGITKEELGAEKEG